MNRAVHPPMARAVIRIVAGCERRLIGPVWTHVAGIRRQRPRPRQPGHIVRDGVGGPVERDLPGWDGVGSRRKGIVGHGDRRRMTTRRRRWRWWGRRRGRWIDRSAVAARSRRYNRRNREQTKQRHEASMEEVGVAVVHRSV